MNYWMVILEPDSYPWEQFRRETKTAWTGVRNFQARNNLRAMKKGDRVFYYHSVTGKSVVGLAEVAREAYTDPTAKEGDWSCVDLVPRQTCKTPVELETIKKKMALKDLPLLRQSRLSVMPVSGAEAKVFCRLGGLK
ncbi:MAG: EVE domain-containing protein [Chthoniobacterales bacterium]